MLYPLLRIAQLAGDVPVAVFPSGHFVDDDVAFVGGVSAALEAAQARPELMVLLGIEATSPDRVRLDRVPGPAAAPGGRARVPDSPVLGEARA